MIARGAALFCDMGVGKTKITIDLAEVLHTIGLVKTVIVVSPLNLVDVWANEIDKHAAKSWYLTAVGAKNKRIDALNTLMEAAQQVSRFKVLWMLMNIDGLKVIEKELRKCRFDLCVIDESTSIQNHRADRTKIALDIFQDAPYKLIMSGNPTPKSPDQIFSQYKLIDPGIFGNSRSRFIERFFEVDIFNKVLGFKSPDAAAEFERLFHSISFRKKKQDCLSLPPKVYEKQYVYMTAEQEKAYRMMESEALAAYEDLNCAAPFVITKYLRLSQIAGGIFPGVDADENKIIKLFNPNPKLDRLVEVIEELPKGEQVVVWARFRPEINFIYERLTAEGYSCVKFYGGVGYKDKIEARRLFKEKQAQIFIANAASGGKGLNDLIGATWSIYYSNDYSAENRQQSEDRNHRNGTIKVTYIDLITYGTIDRQVLAVLQLNKDFSDALLDRKLQAFLERAAQ